MQRHGPDLWLPASSINHTKSPPGSSQSLSQGEGQTQTLSEVHVPRQRQDGVFFAMIMNLHRFSISPAPTKFPCGPGAVMEM